MTTLSNTEITGTTDALARYRFMALRRADEILHDESPLADRPVAPVTDLSALLMASLEELKVAEEELRDRNAALVARRDAEEALTRHYRQLFVEAPVPVLITDVFGTIHEANIAAGFLLRRDPQYLQRKPLAALVHTKHRDEFRHQFTRFAAQDGVRDWHFAINRTGDTPLDVRATVKLIPGLGPTASGVLYWMLEVPNEARPAGQR